MPASTPSTFSAFGVPLVLEADSTSSAGQAGPRAAVPEPAYVGTAGVQRLVLGAQGEQTSTTTATVTTRVAGNLGRAAGTWTQSVSGGAAEDSRGADTVVVEQGFYPVTWSVVGSQLTPMFVNLASGGQLGVYAGRVGVGAWTVYAAQYNPTTDTYGAGAVVVSGLDADHNPWPWLVVLPSGQILCFYWVADDPNALAQINVSISDDDGATWSLYSEAILQTELVGTTNITLNRITVTLVEQQMILTFHVTDSTAGEYIWQWVSADYGATFNYLGKRVDCAYPVLNTVNQTAYMHYLYWTGTGPAEVRVIEMSPQTLFVPADGLNISATGSMNVGDVTLSGGDYFLTRGDLAAAVQGSAIWCYAINTDGTAQYGEAHKFDTTTYSLAGNNAYIYAFWWYDGKVTTTEYPKNFSATIYREQARIYGNFQSLTATYENAISRWDLGGYSTVTMPRDSVIPQPPNYTTYTNHWIPSRLPSGYTYTHVGAGTQDITTTPGWLRNDTTANTCYDYETLSIAADQGAIYLFRLRQVSGGSITDTTIGATIEVATALIKYQAALHVSSSQLRIRDVHGGVNRGTISISTTTGVDVLIAVNFGKVSAWARQSASNWDRKWTTIVNGGTLTDGGAGGADQVTWGNITSGTAISEWQVVNGVSGTLLGTLAQALADGFTNPTDLHAFTYQAGPTYLTANMYYTARGGPGFPGDSYVIRPFADFPICYALPRGSSRSPANVQGGQRPSPQVESRSLATSSWGGAALWRWKYPTAGDRYIPPILILTVVGANFASATVRTRTAAGVSTTRGTLDMTYGATGLAFLRDGNTLVCDTGTASTDNPFFSPDMLAGGYVVFTDGKVRPIVTNGAGNWTNAGTGQPPYIEIDGDDTELASGTINVIWPTATFVFYSTGVLSCESFELYWASAPATYEGYVKVGAVAWCEGVALYQVPSWGNVRDEAPCSEVYSSQWGADRPRQTSTLRRIVELPFVSTYSDQRLRGAQAVVGERIYFTASSTGSLKPIAASDDTARKLGGIWRQVAGASVPVVYVDRMTRGTPNNYTLTGFEAGFLGTIRTVPHFAATGGREAGGIYSQDETGVQWQLVELR